MLVLDDLTKSVERLKHNQNNYSKKSITGHYMFFNNYLQQYSLY